MCNNRLDMRDRLPSGMEDYLSINGWHFNKKMSEWAVSRMKRSKRKGEEPTMLDGWDKAHCDDLFARVGMDVSQFKGYDYVYVLNMARSDFYGTSLHDEVQLAQFVQDYLSDVDGYDGVAFTRFYADCIGLGVPIMWEDML